MDRKSRERRWNKAYSEDRNAVREILLKMESDYDLVDDLMQDTFERAWDKLDQWDHRSSFLTWVCTIANNVGVDHVRRTQAEKRANEVLEVYLPTDIDAEFMNVPYYDRFQGSTYVEEVTGAQDPALHHEAEVMFYDAVEAMPPKMAMAVMMRRDGISNPEIARELECSEKTVRNLITESRQYFRDNQQFNTSNTVSERDEEPLARAARLSQSEVERAAKDRFEKRDSAFEKRRIRREHPDATTREWKELYHA